jgi:hypothetical protein
VRHAALALILAAALAAPAAAGERTLSERGRQVLAHGDYVAWEAYSGQRRALWRDGSVFGGVRLPLYTTLGSDAARRAVAVSTVCSNGYSDDCVMSERRLPRGPSRVLYRGSKREETPIGAMHRGTLALLLGPRPGHRRRSLYVKPRGSSRLRRLVKNVGVSWRLAASGRWAAYETVGGEEEQVRVVDLETGRSRLIAASSTLDEDCRCTTRVGGIGGVALSGRYVYWIESDSPQHMVGDPATARTRIGRARLDTEERPQIDYFVPERLAASLAARGSRVVYEAGSYTEPPAIREVTDPDWMPSGTRIPARL